VLFSREGEVLLDQFLHPFLDGAQFLLAQRLHVEVVVEAVFNRWADCRLGAGVELSDGLSEKVGA